jgi:predicted enzyme related to lactoylglutathione lyase
VHAAVGKIGDLGGGTLAEPMDIGGGNKIAVVRDPQGAVFGLFAGHFDD